MSHAAFPNVKANIRAKDQYPSHPNLALRPHPHFSVSVFLMLDLRF